MSNMRAILIAGVIVAAALLRLVPHPPNMTPTLGLALFAGAMLSDKRIALTVPLLTLLIGDAMLGSYPHMEIVYGAVVLVTSIGFLLSKRASTLRIGCATVSSSLLFYLMTNAGVWAFDGLYPHTLSGLVECYVMALPFFGNQVVADIATVIALFGSARLLQRRFGLYVYPSPRLTRA